MRAEPDSVAINAWDSVATIGAAARRVFYVFCSRSNIDSVSDGSD